MTYNAQIENCPGWWLCVKYEATCDGKVFATRGIIPVDDGGGVEGIRGFTQDPADVVVWCKDGKLPNAD